MLRHLLTAFALLTGLASIGAPMEVRATAFSGQVSAQDDGIGDKAKRKCTVIDRRRADQGRDGSRPECRTPRTTTIIIPTVQLRSDFALE